MKGGDARRTCRISPNDARREFSLRLEAVYLVQYLTSNNANPALVQYEEAKVTWVWKSRYAVTRRLSVFLDLDNIFSESLDIIYAAYPDRVVNNPPEVTREDRRRHHGAVLREHCPN